MLERKTPKLNFEELVQALEGKSDDFRVKLYKLMKDLFEFAHSHAPRRGLYGVLEEIHVDGFDVDQIWTQLELHNQPLMEYLEENFGAPEEAAEEEASSASLDSASESVSDSAPRSASGSSEFSGSSEEDEEDEVGDDDDEDEEMDEKRLEEKFFNLAEMNKFADDMEELDRLEREYAEDGSEEMEMPSSSDDEEGQKIEEIMYGGGSGDDDEDDGKEGLAMKYEDFFPRIQGGKSESSSEEEDVDDEEEEEDEDEDDDEILDPDEDDEVVHGWQDGHGGVGDFDQAEGAPIGFAELFGEEGAGPDGGGGEGDGDGDGEGSDEGSEELSLSDLSESEVAMLTDVQRYKLESRRRMRQLEDKLLAPKSWALSGEVSGKARPVNSLLEAELDFETNARAVPEPTSEASAGLEDLIRRRIKEGSWDDVLRRSEPRVKQARERPELSFERSKKSLAQLYEEDFLRQVGGHASAGREEEVAALDAQHRELLSLFLEVAGAIDALAGHAFMAPTPRAVATPRLTKAARAEDVLPVVAAAAAAAPPPEETMRPMRTLRAEKTERESEELRRDRAKKKRAAAQREKELLYEEKARAEETGDTRAIEARKRRKIEEDILADKRVRVVGKDEQLAVDSRKGSTRLFEQLQAEARSKLHGGPAAGSSADKKKKNEEKDQKRKIKNVML